MADTGLPGGLRYAFLDFNSYFASVEQAERPELLGRPVAVTPVDADSGTVIAASYEAKKYGVRTGTRVGDAKRMCPGLVMVSARHTIYVDYHERVKRAVETVLPIEKVSSIDEMSFVLLGEERRPERAVELAQALKAVIREKVAPSLACSVGLAPNRFLAKMATEFQKPDGLLVIRKEELPDRLAGYDLKTFTGINDKMEARLRARGIFRSDELIRATAKELTIAFGSIVGERWWYLLRGHDVPDPPTQRQSLSHSHVLPPELRTVEGTREVLLRLALKAAARLRSNDLWASRMSISVKGVERSWKADRSLPPTQDSTTVIEAVTDLWKQRDFDRPTQVGVAFSGLAKREQVTPSLFDETESRADLSHAIDDLNSKFGKNTVFLAGMERAKDTASEKIAFNKTWLFSEGKDDNVWVNTRTAETDAGNGRANVSKDDDHEEPLDDPARLDDRLRRS